MRIWGIVLSVICILFLSGNWGCFFGPTKFKGVISYRHGRVFIKHDKFYRVGELSDDWGRMDTYARTITFYNPNFKSSISTDAYCSGQMADRKLDFLGSEILTALENRHIVDETQFDLDGRGAIRRRVEGSMDGVPVLVDLVAVKKNGCIFDMYLVGPRSPDSGAIDAFNDFWSVFHYE